MKRLLLLSTVLLCSSIAMADTKLDIAVTVGEKHLQEVVLLDENQCATIVQDGLICKVSAQEYKKGVTEAGQVYSRGVAVEFDICEETEAGQVAVFPSAPFLLVAWGEQASVELGETGEDYHYLRAVYVTATQE